MREESVDEFLKLLNLNKDKKFGSIDLEAVVRNTYSFVKNIWSSGQKLDKFTDHGIRHSYKTLENALKIADRIIVRYPLNGLEKTILAVACLIHDIGMQCKKYNKWEDLDPDEIRRSHCRIGLEMFKRILEGDSEDLPSLAIDNSELVKPVILEKAMNVAFSHCSMDRKAQELWAKLKNQPITGIPCRLKLLAGLLRLGDELDMCFDRIPEVNRIGSSTLPVESKAHWVCCYYITNVKIESGAGGKGSMRVSIDWWAPNNKDQIDKIRKLIIEKRIHHFNEEIRLINSYLKEQDSIPEPILAEIKELPEPEINESILELPKDVEDHLTRDLYPYTFSKKTVEIPKNLIEINESSFDWVKSKSHEFISLNKGVIPAHYVLKTGFHTNKYIKCRDLICDNDFTLELAKALKEKFSREFKPTRVVSIGTTAIRIGSLLSIFLEVPFSYAVGEVEIALDEFPPSPSFDKYEKVILISREDKLLIIDDILGMGNVFNKIIKQLKNLDIKENDIVFFYIYSLGHEKKFTKEYPHVKIFFLNSFPDINYWQEKEDGTCKICKSRTEIRNYE